MKICFFFSIVSLHIIVTSCVRYYVTTIAGCGKAVEYKWNPYIDGVGTFACFFNPKSLAYSADEHALYVADTLNNLIRKIEDDMYVTTVAGSGNAGDSDGQGLEASFNIPSGITYNNGFLYVTDYMNEAMRKVSVTGVVAKMPGHISIKGIHGIYHNKNSQSFYFISELSYAVYEFAGNQLNILAGDVQSFGFVDGVGTTARFDKLGGITGDESGYLYISDNYNSAIRRIEISSRKVTTLCKNGKFVGIELGCATVAIDGPGQLAIDKSFQFFVIEQNRNRIVRFSPGVVIDIQVVAGGSPNASSLDGYGTLVSFSTLQGLVLDDQNNIYVSEESSSSRIRKIIQCDDYAYFNKKNNTCLSCPVGYVLNETTLVCDKCMANSKQTKCPICSAGYKQVDSKCEQCPVGHTPSLDQSVCLPCSDGTVRPTLDIDHCIRCPDGALCTTTTIQCMPGYTNPSMQSQLECKKCPDGYIKPSEGNEGCNKCPDGTFASDDRIECLSCRRGQIVNTEGQCFQCPAGTETNAERTRCVSCKYGTYKSISMESCVQCPAHATCQVDSFSCMPGFTINSTSGECIKCPDGLVKSVSGNGPCLSCPSGKRAKYGQVFCEACPENTYRSDLAINECLPCPDGAICTSPTEFSCRPGWIRLNDKCLYAGIQSLSQTISKSGTSSPSSSNSRDALGLILTILVQVTIIIFLTIAFYACKVHQKKIRATRFLAAGQLGSSKDVLDGDKHKNQSDQQYSNNSILTLNKSTKSKVVDEDSPHHTSITTSKYTNGTTDTNTTFSGSSGIYVPGFLQFKINADYLKNDESLAYGGSADLFLGHPLHLDLQKFGSTLVIKEFKINTRSSKKFEVVVDSFMQELSIMHMLRNHCNIVQLLGFSENPHHILMKHYPLGNLARYMIDAKWPITRRLQLNFLLDIANGISYITDHGIAHCDLKCSNILVDADIETGKIQCVIADFGLSYLINEEMLKISGFRTIELKGVSFPYSSPEAILRFYMQKYNKQIKYPYEYHPQISDIYSFGVIITSVITRLNQ